MKKIMETNRYRATGNDGRKYEIIETTEFINTTTLSDTAPQWTAGMKALRTSNGDPVNKIGEGTYEILRRGVILKFPGP